MAKMIVPPMMAQAVYLYKFSKSGVLRSDGASIPADPVNRDWRQYLEWLADGNITDPEFTAQEIADNLITAETEGLKEEIRVRDIFYLRIIVELFTNLRKYTDFSNLDMPPALLTKMQNLMTRLDRLKEIDE